MQPSRGTKPIDTMGILRRIFTPNKGEPEVKLEAFLRQNSRARNEGTFRIYQKEIKRFQGWLGTRPLTAETVVEYDAWLRSRFKPNSLSNKVIGVNLYLKWRRVDARLRRPAKEVPPNPNLISDAEYRKLLERIQDAEERLVVRLLHDSALRPSDIVDLRLQDLDTSDGLTVIRKRTQKTGTICESFLTKDTADELHGFVASTGRTDYVFPGESKPWRHRTWPNQILRKYHAEGITPRTFRRTLATNWDDDLKSLMTQGGWADAKTVLTVYRKDVRERHLRSFEKAVGPARDPEPEDDVPGYG